MQACAFFVEGGTSGAVRVACGCEWGGEGRVRTRRLTHVRGRGRVGETWEQIISVEAEGAAASCEQAAVFARWAPPACATRTQDSDSRRRIIDSDNGLGQ